MGDQEPRVYTDPEEPGAPQVGDVVVVDCVVEPDHPGATWRSWWAGRIVELVAIDTTRPRSWCVHAHGHGTAWVHSIHRPTEVELATWALAQPCELPHTG